jgi:tetratricopeptide (TPR) repeat protein
MKPTDNPALQRLERLERYVTQDPNNLSLLRDAFDVALEAGELARAEFHLRHAQALGAAPLAWGMRQAQLLLAQHRWDDAEQCLRGLLAGPDVPAEVAGVLTHDLAYVALRRGDVEAGIALLSPVVEPCAAADPLDPGLQLLWLRLLHRGHRLDQAVAWAGARWAAKQLAPAAAGAASLIALDADDAPQALQWAQHALGHDERQLEALVTRATLALGQNDAALARQLLSRALQHNAADGRILSALAFTDLLERRLDAARTNFQQAVQTMPGHVGTWHGLGWTLLLQNDLAAAERAFQAALALDRNFSENHGGLAVIQAMQGQAALAEQSIERALRLERGCVSAQFAQAILRGEARDMQAIRRLATRTLGGRPALLGGTVFEAVARAAPALQGPSSDEPGGPGKAPD